MCKAWQLMQSNYKIFGSSGSGSSSSSSSSINKEEEEEEKEEGPGPTCALLSEASIKPAPGGEKCTSGAMLPPVPPARLNRTSYSGVWWQHGDLDTIQNLSFVVGGDFAPEWASMEVSEGVWDFRIVDSQLNAMAQQHVYIETALQVGPASPMWLYNRSKTSAGGTKKPDVTAVEVIPKEGHENQAKIFPYYLDPTYQSLFLRAVDAYAAHLASSIPNATRRMVVAAQAMYGSTGDDCPWHGTPRDARFDINTTQWQNLTHTLAAQVCRSYTSRGFKVLWNSQIDNLDYFLSICPGSFIKAGMVSHGFQVNYEADNMLGKGAVCHKQGIHCRGESWPFSQHGYFQEAPLWAVYAHKLWLLTFGVDMPGLSAPQLVEPANWPMYHLYNKYASSVRPPVADWIGGVVALRDGLDSANWTRFPNSTYGEAKSGNADRLLAIAKANAHRGAAMGDVEAATKDAMASRKRKSMNDVGWRIWQGNYGNGAIVQLAPTQTSVGWWRVGPKHQPYGRFARGFEHSSGKTSMAFVLHKGLWGGLPLRPATSDRANNNNKASANSSSYSGSGDMMVINFVLVYFDEGNGKFDLMADTLSGCRTLTTINVGNTKNWIEHRLSVSDGRFNRGCVWSGLSLENVHSGADIVLKSHSADTIVHSIEVFRAT